MLPLILAAVGGYFIGDSMKEVVSEVKEEIIENKLEEVVPIQEEKPSQDDNYSFADGGMMDGDDVIDAVGYLVSNGKANIKKGEKGWLVSNLDEDEDYIDVRYSDEDILYTAYDRGWRNEEYADGGVMEKGGGVYEDFGYNIINKEMTLKNGEKIYITKGRYYFANELGDGRISGIYYKTNDGSLISADLIKFSKGGEMANGGKVSK